MRFFSKWFAQATDLKILDRCWVLHKGSRCCSSDDTARVQVACAGADLHKEETQTPTNRHYVVLKHIRTSKTAGHCRGWIFLFSFFLSCVQTWIWPGQAEICTYSRQTVDLSAGPFCLFDSVQVLGSIAHLFLFLCGAYCATRTVFFDLYIWASDKISGRVL